MIAQVELSHWCFGQFNCECQLVGLRVNCVYLVVFNYGEDKYVNLMPMTQNFHRMYKDVVASHEDKIKFSYCSKKEL